MSPRSDAGGVGPGSPAGPVDPVPVVVGLARALRAAGVPVGRRRVLETVRALESLDPAVPADVYWAGRLAMCGHPDDIDRYDRVFEAVFAGRAGGADPPAPGTILEQEPRMADAAGRDRGGGEDGGADETVPLATAASRTERLRHRDFADLTAAERREIDRLLARLRLPGETRRTRRHRPSHRGSIDRARTVRAMLARGGEPARLHRRRRRERPRRVVVLVDVSGSMGPYATALLRFAHAAARREAGRTEVFTIGTRLTRVTREMSHRDPDLAMRAVGGAVPDWSGGTRLGDMLKAFLDRWGQRGTARGAVVVVLSDGWERGDVARLAEQMARLQRLAHRVVWANPRKARPGYEPRAAGMAAALDHVDDFVAGNDLAALEELARVVAGARSAPPRPPTGRPPVGGPGGTVGAGADGRAGPGGGPS